MNSENVYAVWDYWNGVRSGFADFCGAPHYFEAEWSDADDDYLPSFSLKRVDRHTMELVLEAWQVFRTWEIAFHRGMVPLNTHPALSGQNGRAAELSTEIVRILKTSEVAASGVLGTFEPIERQQELPPRVSREYRVVWRDPAARSLSETLPPAQRAERS
jgi:hypothetical protein